MRAEPLQSTRVRRFYRGGALLGTLRGQVEDDDYRPEDWVGSVTVAAGGGPDEGLSRIADGRLLRDVVRADPVAWLGQPHLERFGTETGLLVKLLDSAERLPVHAHPDRAFAARRLSSAFGKTEAWIVVATRAGEAEVWVGLREAVDPGRYRGWVLDQAVESLLGSLNRVRVRAGDVVFVPAGVPHAIGAGVLIAELQEPTDFSIVVEWTGFPVDPDDAHLGLGWDAALEALDLRAHEPVLGLPPAAGKFFGADGRVEAPGRFCVLVVLEGEGAIDGLPARAGDGFVVPAACNELEAAGELRVLRCLAPDP
jgi:mannose-6-phosphate isomerase